MEWITTESATEHVEDTRTSSVIITDDNVHPYLEILVQPQSKFRFRYNSEMSGKHGSLMGSSGVSNESHSGVNKLYPTIKLNNYKGKSIIRCSLVCDTIPYYPHAHVLCSTLNEIGDWNSNISSESSRVIHETPNFVEGVVSEENDYTTIFQGLNIIYTGKKSVKKEITKKFQALEENDPRKASMEGRVDDLSMQINLNVVSLYFEAFAEISPGILKQICSPVVSQPIQHNKSTQTSELRIVRIDKYTSFCTGDEEVFILVEKVDKHNIQIKFFQENVKGIEIWKAYGKFTKLDVHHQYAIVFRTPAYRSCDIETEVDVWVQLERPSDGATSQQIPFKYKPLERLRKMPRIQAPRNQRVDTDEGASSSTSQNQSDISNNPKPTDNVVGDGELPGPSSSSGSSSIRQGSNIKFPCDLAQLKSQPNQDKLSKVFALNVALSVGECLHTWAETSDFNFVLQRLRHLLCLVNEQGDNTLHTAILNDQVEPFLRILNVIKSSTDVSSIINESNLSGLTPLASAVMLNAEYYVETLLIHGADPSIPNFDGDCPIHLAIKSNHVNCLNLLLCSKKSQDIINRYNYNSLTPLHIAVTEGQIDSVDLLTTFKANVFAQEGTYGRTPLHIAVERGYITLAILLLKSIGDKDLVNIQNYRGDTALHCAVSAEHPNLTLCAVLLHFGADPLIENFIKKESEENEIESGCTVFDLCNSEEICKLLNSPPSYWEQTIKAYLNNIENDTNITKEQLTSFSSIFSDSGIDIKEFN